MSYQYWDAQGNNYVRGWGNDFTDAEKKELGIGQYRADGPAPGRTNSSLDKRIEDLFSSLPTSTGWPEGGTTIKDPRTPYPEAPGRTNPEDWIMDGPAPDPSMIPTNSWPTSLPRGPIGRINQAPRPEGLQRVATGIADWVTGNKWDFDQRGGSGIPRGRGQYDPQDRILTEEQWGNVPPPDGTQLTPPMQTPPADIPTPPLEKTLEQRVWERDQMPKRTPDAQGRLYPDKNDPGFIDPRVRGDGSMTMQYIPELDDPNWTPWKNYGPGWSREQDWNKGGEGVQYRM